MLQVVIIPLVTLAIVAAIVLAVSCLTRARRKSADERLNQKFDYRKEPHADQTTEHPGRLSDNEVTRG